MAFVRGEFCIDRWEASLVEIGASGERPFSPYRTPTGATIRAVSAENTVPQGYISRDDADRACHQAGKRLCRDEEWLTACRGDPPHIFPYGDSHQKGACNDSGRSPLRELYPDSPDTYRDGPMNDPRLNQRPATLAKSGAFARCTNGYGVFDLVGNLHEWVMSARPTFRGGYYLDTHFNGDGCSYHTTAHGADYHDYSTGFRCCRGIEPGRPRLRESLAK
ncbi:MAG: formylglycine-generating enzyme family protein [Myxococcota bacterium]|nr:formylglycine-generating enzyme family protein [Myxococcota bacterium]